MANPGTNQAVPVNAIVTLNGAGSNDPNARPSGATIAAGAFTWTQTRGIPVDLADPQSASPAAVPADGGRAKD